MEDYTQDIIDVLNFGVRKYKRDGWLDPNGKGQDPKSQVKSIASHSAECFAGHTEDHESGLHPALHIAARAMMIYIRSKEGITSEVK